MPNRSLSAIRSRCQRSHCHQQHARTPSHLRRIIQRIRLNCIHFHWVHDYCVRKCVALVLVSACVFGSSTGFAADSKDTNQPQSEDVQNDKTQPGKINFARQVLPILSDKCFLCHGPDTQDDNLVRLDSFDGATADLGGYKAVDTQHPDQSELLARIFDSDDPMPPADAEKSLSDGEKQILKQWVEQGGGYAKHWAFVAPKKSTPEGMRADASGEDVIDAFIQQGMQDAGISFANSADRSTLARRVALTLTGLPPEPHVLESYMQDASPEAFDRLLDALFDSPRYGEHQARYWLDAVRYGDTHGLHLDNRRGIYPYRDWVVRAMNEDLPLDDFIVWQIAGDLLESPTLEQQVATGFVRMNPSTSEGGAIPAEFQAKNNFDRTETLGTVLLGMTFTCARCHTHKYDPITQTEYYQLFAFFNSTAESPLDGNKYDYGNTVRAPQDQEAWEMYQTLVAKKNKLLTSAQKKLEKEKVEIPAAWDTEEWLAMDPEEKLRALRSAKSPFSGTTVQTKAKKLSDAWRELEDNFTTTLVAKDLGQPRETKRLHRGEYDQPTGDPLQPDVPSVMNAFPDDAPRNRLGLAQWLVDPAHPLTSRVVVNRIWQRVFGYGLVRTPEDFGLQGQQPTHPELLDWLAVELQESGWDLQHMLRLMLNSRTFQQSSAWRNDVDDPENRLYARGPSYRLDAEVIRDTALWASELLDPHMGGEGVKPYQPAGMWKALAHPASNTKQYEQDSGQRLYRRSLYVYWKRTSPHPMMTLFDAPDRESSCVRRSRTNTSLQSLGLLNETQRIEMAKKFAERLLTTQDRDNRRIELMFQLLACRKPSGEEQKACTDLLKQMRDRYKQSPEDAGALLSHGEAMVTDQIEPQELAAWTQVAVTVLASDVALVLY